MLPLVPGANSGAACLFAPTKSITGSYKEDCSFLHGEWLSPTKKIVRGHGGRIGAGSRSGEGTVCGCKQGSATVLVVLAAVMPSTFVIIPVMISIIIAFAVIAFARRNEAGRCKGNQSQ